MKKCGNQGCVRALNHLENVDSSSFGRWEQYTSLQTIYL